MKWVVDTCVIIDILDRVQGFADSSADALDAKRPIADVMIGAYAMSMGGLITRNEDDFRLLYPDLTIYNPIHSNA